MSTICESRIAKKGKYIQFGNKKGRCFLEFRCDKPATESGLCSNCSKKNSACRTQDTRTFEHGRVWEPLPDKSQIYGGPWYYRQIELHGEPSADDLEIAITHQEKARKGFPHIPQIEYMPPKKENPIKKVKSADDISEISAESSTGSSSKSSRSSTKKPTAKSKPKQPVNKLPPITLPDQLTLYPIYVEVNEEPVEIGEIEHITISEFEYDDDLYYKCNEDQRVFSYLPNGNIGCCIGVYKDNTIIDYDEFIESLESLESLGSLEEEQNQEMNQDSYKKYQKDR
jgi:hypothetical protein